uniref:Uncharacterized protein n=1 Tax=Anopheles albimanus TaxID=7167 RepID=A0A182FTB3_ANOAL
MKKFPPQGIDKGRYLLLPTELWQTGLRLPVRHRLAAESHGLGHAGEDSSNSVAQVDAGMLNWYRRRLDGRTGGGMEPGRIAQEFTQEFVRVNDDGLVAGCWCEG